MSPTREPNSSSSNTPAGTPPTTSRLVAQTNDTGSTSDRGRSLNVQHNVQASSSRESSLGKSADRLKTFGKFVKQKGQHLRAKSEALMGKYNIPSPPAFSSPEENDQRMAEEFSELAVDAPPTGTTSGSAPNPAGLSPPPQVTENPDGTGAPPARRTSFRHEHYPRRPVASSSDGGHEAPAVFTPDGGSHVDIKIPALLQQGTPMLKISSKNIKTRVFRIDPKLGQIRWDSNSAGIGKYSCTITRSLSHFVP